MRTKTCDLMGAALEWAVAKCEGGEGLWYDTVFTHWIKIDGKDCALSKGWAQSFTPSTDWVQGGPIIEREGITLGDAGGSWVAGKSWADDFFSSFVMYGPTPLIAAMRCYVASKMGDEIEIPQELT